MNISKNILSIIAVVFLTASFLISSAFSGQSGLSPSEEAKISKILARGVIRVDVFFLTSPDSTQVTCWSGDPDQIPPDLVPSGRYWLTAALAVNQGEGVWGRAFSYNGWIVPGDVPVFNLDEYYSPRIRLIGLPPDLATPGHLISIRLLSNEQDWEWEEAVSNDGSFTFSYWSAWSEMRKPLRAELYSGGQLIGSFVLPDGFDPVQVARGLTLDWNKIQSPPPVAKGIVVKIPF